MDQAEYLARNIAAVEAASTSEAPSRYRVIGPGFEAEVHANARSGVVYKVTASGASQYYDPPPELRAVIGQPYSKLLVVCRRNSWPAPDQLDGG